MSTSDEWSTPGRPVPPPPSGYEAVPTVPTVEPSPGGYLAQTYPAQGYPPAPEDGDEEVDGAGAQGYGPPVGPRYGPPADPGGPYGAPPPPVYDHLPAARHAYPPPPPGYGYGHAPAYPQPTHTEGMAIAALVTGLVSLLACLVFAGPVAVGLGAAALRRIRAKGTRGRGMAVTGVVTGGIATVILVIFVVAMIGSIGSS